MNLELSRTQYGLCPIDDESVEAIKKVKMGDVIIVEWKPRRNYGFHKKLFSMLRAVLPHQKHYINERGLLEAIKFRAGYFDTILTHDGQQFKASQSISFSSMDEAEFGRFYNEANKVCCELVGDEALNEILSYI